MIKINNLELLTRLLFYIIEKEQVYELLKTAGFDHNTNFVDMITVVERHSDIVGNDLSDFFALFRYIARMYNEASYLKDNSDKLDTTQKMYDYFEISFLGVDNEEVHAVGLDDELHITCKEVLSIGTPSKVAFALRCFTTFVIKNNLSRIIIAHNHSNGSCLPSDEDFRYTKKLIDFLNMIDTELVDHIVIGKGGAYSMRSSYRGCEIWG